LMLNYVGHGGEVGWGHERVLDVPTINAWTNLDRLCLFMTATCEFSRFDDPDRTSGGEHVFLNKNGGGIALLTTTRLVFSSPNFTLNNNFFDYVLQKTNGESARLGDIVLQTKIASTPVGATSSNHRNFTLLGDPAIKLNIPKNNVVLTEVNGNPVASLQDTLKALSEVTIKGYVSDYAGTKLSGYNGFVFPSIFDKPKQIKTLQNDGGAGLMIFDLQKSVIYKGKASVTNGDFQFSFVVPKDINYKIDKGRLTFYATGVDGEASGYSSEFYIGGNADSILVDEDGPELELYMNDYDFVDGGVTDENPILLVKITDESGINTTGNGIGHDLTATLDGESDAIHILNDYYETDLDTYKSGGIRFPFSTLEPGNHNLEIKVWDVHNNSNKKTVEFLVSKSEEMVIDHLLNYPNPFTTRTEFFFEHNQACHQVEVQIQIFTVSGKVVKTINRTIEASGFRSEGIEWNGKDEYGSTIGRGVYVYKIKVWTPDGKKAEKIEKLVILK